MFCSALLCNLFQCFVILCKTMFCNACQSKYTACSAPCNQQCMCKFLDLLLPKYEKPWGTMGEAKKQRAGSHFTNVLDFFRFAQTLWKLCRIEFSVLFILVFCSVMFCRKMRCNHLSKHNSPCNQQCRSKLLDLLLPKDEILGEQLAKQKSRINVVTFLVMQRCYTKLYDAL